MATYSSVLAWRILGMAGPGGLSSMGSHRVGHDWSDLAAAAASMFRKDLRHLWLALSLCVNRKWRLTHSCKLLLFRAKSPQFSSVQFNRSVVSDSLQPHESQHARPPCPSPSPGVHSNSCPSSRWCHPTISSSVVPFSSCPQIPPSIRVFSNESTLRMRWPKYWSFSFNIITSKEHPGLISFRMDWLDLLAVQGTLKSLLQHRSSEKSPQWYPTLCDPTDCSPPGSSVHGILQARILEWVAMPSSRGSSQSRDGTWLSPALAGEFFTTSATWEAL